MSATIMASALAAHHKTHSYPIVFLAHITVLFSFSFRHLNPPSSLLCDPRIMTGARTPSEGASLKPQLRLFDLLTKTGPTILTNMEGRAVCVRLEYAFSEPESR